MADNSSVPVASGNETFANDDIGGVKYPRPKINWGPDGTANDVDVASGKPLPVQLRGSDGTDRSNALPVTGTFWQATQPVSGTFWQATQPVSIATAPVLVAGSAIIGKVGIDQTTPGTTDRVTVGGITLIDVTLSLDTSAYANGDLLADTQAVANAVRVNDGTGILHSVMIIDEDDQGAAFDLYFLSANNTLGSENSAPSISDGNARDILCRVSVATADYTDLGGVKVAQIHSLNRIIKGVSGGTSIYVAAVNGTGTPTYTASGVKLRIGIIQN